ncbi:MAG: hypothetical protein HUK20_01145 [Fibrobacter sp.]|nr:hypothetical protein [Fibrobacter sp.]
MMKKILFLMLALIVGGMAVEPQKSGQLIRVRYYDGSYEDYPIAKINKITFKSDASDTIVSDSDGVRHKELKRNALSDTTVLRPSDINKIGGVAHWSASTKMLSLESPVATAADVYIFDHQGICIAKKKAFLKPGSNDVSFNNLDVVRKTYIARVKTASKDVVLKIQEAR